jgi:hypothetical protein
MLFEPGYLLAIIGHTIRTSGAKNNRFYGCSSELLLIYGIQGQPTLAKR